MAEKNIEIKVCMGTGGVTAGGEEVLEAFETVSEENGIKVSAEKHCSVHKVGCRGLCAKDVLVDVVEPTFPGCIMAVRPVGVFLMEDDKGVDEKILAVPVDDPRHHEFRVLSHVPPHLLKEIEHFFGVYKDLEGKRTTITGWRDIDVAHRIIEEAMERYEAEDPTARPIER